MQDGRITIGGNFPNGGASQWIYQAAHGAVVLSTMAGHLDTPDGMQYLGSAPDAAYVLFRTEEVHWEHLVEEYHWVAAAERADSMGCDVLNTSLGYSLFDDATADHSTVRPRRRHLSHYPGLGHRGHPGGMLVFNSAGNSGNSPWEKITAPADGDSVIAVGAVDAFGQHASFSGYGPSADGQIKPDLSGTGRDAYYIHPDGTIRPGNGTSFSSPILCGAATRPVERTSRATCLGHPSRIDRIRVPSRVTDTVLGFGIPTSGPPTSPSAARHLNCGDRAADNVLVCPTRADRAGLDSRRVRGRPTSWPPQGSPIGRFMMPGRRIRNAPGPTTLAWRRSYILSIHGVERRSDFAHFLQNPDG